MSLNERASSPISSLPHGVTRAEKSPVASFRAAAASSMTGRAMVPEAGSEIAATTTTAAATNQPICPSMVETAPSTRSPARRASATTTSRGAASTTASSLARRGANANSVSWPR